MAAITVLTAAQAGAAVAYEAANIGGDTVANNGQTLLIIDNQDASPHTATIASQAAAREGYTPADLDLVVEATTTKVFGPFSTKIWNDDNGNLVISWDDVTSVTLIGLNPA